jgi:glycosyltransferase involved in cell wall biosynthesis
MKVAAYCVALNEEKHVERWVEATAGADFRLVCDTGSTDGTVEKLRALGVTVYEIRVKPWRFDVARNTAQSLLPDDIDVCHVIDMDETVDADFYDKVRENWQEGANKGWHEFDTGHTWMGARLHARHGIYWRWPVHEAFVPSLNTPLRSVTIPSKMYHKPDATKSRSQYLSMLINASKEFPKDHRIWVYLCREYTFNRMWELVISAAEQVTKYSDDWYVERAAVCRWASEANRMLQNIDEAHRWADKAIEIDPCGENYFEKVRCYYAQSDWGGMWETCKKVAACEPTKHYLSSEALWRWQLDDMRALAAHYLGDKRKAVKYGQMAYDNNPADLRLKNNMDWYNKGIEEQIKANNPSE